MHSALDAYCTYHSPKNAWGIYFKHSPRWLFWCWGTAILALSTVYSWATIVFGMRFSNLTNRVREEMCSRQTDLLPVQCACWGPTRPCAPQSAVFPYPC